MKAHECRTVADLDHLDVADRVVLASRPMTHLDLLRERLEMVEWFEQFAKQVGEALERLA